VRFIIPVLVGAIIGYITNWLAIKMLFRPYEEKRIFGIHIPFTPGLIPKERSRIAKKVGEVVGDYLLSPEVIMNWLCEKDLEGHIRKWIESNVNSLKVQDKPLKEFIDNHIKILDNIKDKIAFFVFVQIQGDRFKEKVKASIQSYLLPKSMDCIYEFMDKKMESSIYEMLNSDETKNLLKDVMENKLSNLAKDERSLKESIPLDTKQGIENYVKGQNEHIANIIRDMLDDPNVEVKVKTSINNLVSQYMNKIVSLFIGPELISNKVYAKIKEYAHEPEFNEKVTDVLMIVMDKIMENKISSLAAEVMSKLSQEKMMNVSSKIIDVVSKEENISKIVDIIGRNIKGKEMEIQNSLLSILTEEIEMFLSSENLYEKIYVTVDNIVEYMANKPISSIFKFMDTSIVSEITDLCINVLNRFIENRLPQLLKLLDVSTIVEEEINGYDVAFAEELIFQIAQKELKAITWLGGLLGAIIGLLTPILQMR